MTVQGELTAYPGSRRLSNTFFNKRSIHWNGSDFYKHKYGDFYKYSPTKQLDTNC